MFKITQWLSATCLMFLLSYFRFAEKAYQSSRCHYPSDYLYKVDLYHEEPNFINVDIPKYRYKEEKDEKIHREILKKFMVKFYCK